MEPALGIFARLLGFCFSAAIGQGMDDTHCFTDMYDGGHVRDVHVVSRGGEPVYRGESIYSLAPDGLVFTYVNSNGGAGTGTARVEGDRLIYEMTMRAAPGRPDQRLKGSWLVREDGFDAHSEGQPIIRYLPER